MRAVEFARVETASGEVVCERCAVARSFARRAVGLLGRRGLAEGEGMWFPRTSSIHMLFMRFEIDAVFVDGEGQVVKVAPALRPWRLAAAKGADAVLELAAGQCAALGVGEGTRLRMVPAS